MKSKILPIAVVVVALVGIGTYAYIQHDAATTLSARVAADAEEAARAHNAATALAAQLAAAAKAEEAAQSEAAATQAQAISAQLLLEATQAQAAADHEQLEVKLAAETRPDLPISLRFRRGLVTTGLVAMFRNTSSKELEFLLDLQSPVTGRHASRSVVLNPNAMLEIGGLQNWAFAPGQRITLTNPNYRPFQHIVGG